ncbi:hypothetical protein OJ997_27400 [Solirubrobacter phytolaccae]|uniref:Uncharacterized protein n=1 Tax=Solirubrobacter phytolaccae TaxID=1404360 RepID=A0A9X3NFJ8_9ACTN|nr:hypothetical protein [Solirubrobacter phytolaccae]MDA0184065.1 hypothetical protein [Solirubrobacter phytolaccae]
MYAMGACAAGSLVTSFFAAWAATHQRPWLTRALVALCAGKVAFARSRRGS